jgi:hypothetical protein
VSSAVPGRLLRMGDPYVEKEFIKTAQAQRAVNCARGLPSVRKEGLRDKHAAIVGFGPSLVDTWPKLLQQKYDAIWTVSKAHDFLVERGIVPTHHTDTDFREHKALYNKLWQAETRYVLATQVHPSYIDKLAGHRVELFHVMNSGLFDMRYLRQPVCYDAGLQTARLAYEIGYRTQDWFGMDASTRPEATHAGPHEGWRIIEATGCEPVTPMPVEVAGQERAMNQLLVRQALFVEKVLRETPKMKVTIHGDGALRPFLQERRRCQVW